MKKTLMKPISDAEMAPPTADTANPARGLPHHEDVVDLLAKHPVGDRLTIEQFDLWAQSRGLLEIPVGATRGSDAWMAHLQRRHQLRYNLNRAGAHPRMLNAGAGVTSFVIERVNSGMLVIRATHDAIVKDDSAKKVEHLVRTKRKHLRYLMESADWSVLPPDLRGMAEEMYFDIDTFRQELAVKVKAIAAKLARMEQKLRRAIAAGEIIPRNGGIKTLTDGQDSDDDDDDDKS